MDYQFEMLGDERFQEFCQALLVKDFPNVQCFPVGQPDGGRDAIMYVHSSESIKDFIVFQVKFVRRPQTIRDAHQWLVNIMKEEAPKVAALASQGAQEYYLLTNISGTAHPGVGSIDRLIDVFKEVLTIPGTCWWRDDLNRRLDSAWDLKWAYPDLMTGTDMLRSIVEAGLSEDHERRAAALRAFMRKQYEQDKEIRFQQVELENRLVNLFVDVPMALRATDQRSKALHRGTVVLHQIQVMQRSVLGRKPSQDLEDAFAQEFDYYPNDSGMGAADVLLSPVAQEQLPQLVLEGAPGQGKSTLAQYICQAHRMRILGLLPELEALPENHRPLSTRIPFKVDLRDYATWLSRQDPFTSEEHATVPSGWNRSLESFLAALVRHQSGGFESFTVEDLHAVARVSALLLVLDGFDEVAEPSRRQDIVSEVVVGTSRLRESCPSLQVVITSRPSAFSNSPGFPLESFPHFELTSISREQIDEYAEKWFVARKLDERDQSDIRRILREKLDQPHLRDLSRNPMQLAILLSLINAERKAIPEKRTALYFDYMRLFFNREADKSPIVQEHKTLLQDIHGYLAWVLHSEAEQGHNRGSISIERLKALLPQYLQAEGRNPALSDALFRGMVERVVALVSRVQGTYEFEVQPLREYFAAHYLYNTAPTPPPGRMVPGTRPDRFAAVARNFYWLNVTRFFAGFYNKGELPSLVEGLQELIDDPIYRNTNYPRMLAGMLLSDLVFEQSPRSMQAALELILGEPGLRYIFGASTAPRRSDLPLLVRDDRERDRLVSVCFDVLRQKPAADRVTALTAFLAANAGNAVMTQAWYHEVLAAHGAERSRWLWYGELLGLFGEIERAQAESLIEDTDSADWRYLVYSRFPEVYERSERRCERLVDDILSTKLALHGVPRNKSILVQFGTLYSMVSSLALIRAAEPVPAIDVCRRYLGPFFHGSRRDAQPAETPAVPINNALQKCEQVITIANRELERNAIEWFTDVTPWDAVVETSRLIWGERWIHYHIAGLASSIKFPPKSYRDCSRLLDNSASLCRRALYAKSKPEDVPWWTEQLATASTEQENMFVALLACVWGSSSILMTLSNALQSIVGNLRGDDWHHYVHSYTQLIHFARRSPRTGPNVNVNALTDELSPRLATLLGIRASEKDSITVYKRYLGDYHDDDKEVLHYCQESALRLLATERTGWQEHLDVLARSYSAGCISSVHMYFEPSDRASIMPILAAKEVVEHSDRYPLGLVARAEAQCRNSISADLVPLAKIAKRDDWFPQLPS